MPEKINSLIRKLEEASGATREMDVRIEVTRRALLQGLGAAAIASQFARIEGIGIGKFAKAEEVPFYTSSIDAARTLVPEGLGFILSGPYVGYRYECKIFAATGESQTLYKHSELSETTFAANEALALCIAALKAIDSKPDKSHA